MPAIRPSLPVVTTLPATTGCAACAYAAATEGGKAEGAVSMKALMAPFSRRQTITPMIYVIPRRHSYSGHLDVFKLTPVIGYLILPTPGRNPYRNNIFQKIS